MAKSYTQPQAGPLVPSREWAPRFLIVPAGAGLADATLPGASATLLNGASVMPAQGGLALDLSGSTSYATLPASDNYNILGPLTLVWYGVIKDVSNYNFLLSSASGGAASNNPFELRIDPYSGPTITRSNASYYTQSAIGTTPVGAAVCIVVTHGGDLSVTDGAFYIDGVKYSSNTGSPSSSGPAIGNANPLTLGTRGDLYSYAKTQTLLAAGFDRVLTADQAAALSVNPWQLLQTPRRVFRVSGGPAVHDGAGALAADAATVAGTAAHIAKHGATGALTAQSATIGGTAERSGSAATHAASGALTAQSAVISGTASHFTTHAASGALTAQAAAIAGVAAHYAKHTASGALAAQSAIIAGTASRVVLVTHTATGVLIAQSAIVSGGNRTGGAAPDYGKRIKRPLIGKTPKSRREIADEFEAIARQLGGGAKQEEAAKPEKQAEPRTFTPLVSQLRVKWALPDEQPEPQPMAATPMTVADYRSKWYRTEVPVRQAPAVQPVPMTVDDYRRKWLKKA